MLCASAAKVSSCDTCRGVYSVLLVCIWFCHRGVLQSNFLLYSLAILSLCLSGKAFFILLLRFLESMTAALLEMLATQIIVKNRYAWCSAKRSKLTVRISWSPDSSGRRLLWEKCSFVLRNARMSCLIILAIVDPKHIQTTCRRIEACKPLWGQGRVLSGLAMDHSWP